jgi:hypothetical protein
MWSAIEITHRALAINSGNRISALEWGERIRDPRAVLRKMLMRCSRNKNLVLCLSGSASLIRQRGGRAPKKGAMILGPQFNRFS